MIIANADMHISLSADCSVQVDFEMELNTPEDSDTQPQSTLTEENNTGDCEVNNYTRSSDLQQSGAVLCYSRSALCQ